jgi:T5SS/PEP-CTERM-associated repeat protein
MIQGGGQLSSATGDVCHDEGSTGTVTVYGAGSTWTNSTWLQVGLGGSGTLSIQAGGQVSNTIGFLGNGSASIGTAIVSGTGSTWTNSLELHVGYFRGSGSLTVADGGVVTVQTLYASLDDLHGNGTITARGAVLDNDLVFDATHGLSQVIGFGTGGTLDLTMDANSDLGAGNRATGTLRIADGVSVASSNGCLGYHQGANGTATVSGAGSTWTNKYQLNITGELNIKAGGQVSDSLASLGGFTNSSGVVTVSGPGSKWTNSATLRVGDQGSGVLNIQAGGQVSSGVGFLGGVKSVGAATVCGSGSTWTVQGGLRIGSVGGGTLTVADGGGVTAPTVSIDNTGTIRLNVSGDGMIMLGRTATVGTLTNNGSINFYAGPALAARDYHPISEFSARPMTWTGSGSYNAVGGTWDGGTKTFTVSPVIEFPAGTSAPIASAQRLLFTDTPSNQQLGASFGTVGSGVTFSASPMAQSDVDKLLATAGFQGSVALAWNFTTNVSGEVLLSEKIDPATQNWKVWQYQGGAWTQYTPSMLTFSADGTLSFTADHFSGYAVSASVPEPAAFGLLVAAGSLLLGRQTRRRPQAV